MYQAYEGQVRNGQPIFLEAVTLPENARLLITVFDVEETTKPTSRPATETANSQETQQMKILTPKVYEDVDKIKENLDQNITSVVRLEETEEEVAKKIADYILNDMQDVAQVVRVAQRVFCIAPLDCVITQSRQKDRREYVIDSQQR